MIFTAFLSVSRDNLKESKASRKDYYCQGDFEWTVIIIARFE